MSRSFVKILDTKVVDQIAAGEVVEKPSSVVKELVENALDAGAKNIRVLIKNGGLDLISITDDGRGMGKEDLEVAVERFATSKLTRAEDLESLYTYGFRGEALPSIASVSRFSIKTREKNSPRGHILEFDHVGKKHVSEVHCDTGTIIEVKDLFYNVPARKKFLKSSKSESNSIKTIIAEFSLAKPEVSFLLQEDSHELLSLGVLDLLPDRVKKIGLITGNYVTVFKERNYQSRAISGAEHDAHIKVHGLISEPIHCPKVSSKMKILVNERIIKSNFILRAIRDGYESLLKHGYYPSGVIYVDLSPHELDVNVHPQKTEVRFSTEGMVFSMVKSAVQDALTQSSSLRNVFSNIEFLQSKTYHMHAREEVSQDEIKFLGNGGMVSYSRPHHLNSSEQDMRVHEREPNTSSYNTSKQADVVPNALMQSYSVPNDNFIDTEAAYRYKFLGQAFKLYLFFASQEKIAVIDMHAAHERVTFYNLKKQYLEKKIVIQELLFPITLPISILENTVSLDERLESLKLLGVDAESRNNEILVRGMSPLLNLEKAENIISELLNKAEGELVEAEIARKLDSYIARLACHASLRRGRELKPDEAYELLDQVQVAENSGWCPHGRPVVWWITELDLEKQFGRVQ